MIEVDVMFPVMVVNDLQALKLYYESVFSFKTVFYDESFYLHLISPNNAIQLGFLMPKHASQPEFLHSMMVTEGFVISLEVKDASAAYAQAQSMNLDIAMPLKVEEWGQTHFMLQDPAGLRLDIIENVKMSE